MIFDGMLFARIGRHEVDIRVARRFGARLGLQ
jgi:hypothetical protein